MSKISKYKENIYNFLTTKSCFANIIDKNLIKDFMESELCLFPIALSAVFSSQIKKNKVKSFHTLHIASAIILMTIIVLIDENKKYYDEKYGDKNIKKIINQATIFIFEAISQNIKTLENTSDLKNESELKTILKIKEKITSFLHDKLLTLTEASVAVNKKLKMKKTDIIKYKFKEKDILETKYKKLCRIDNPELVDYINNKYAIIGQCSFILGWLMGMNDANQKTMDTISKLGTSFGILVKLTNDFNHLEKDIKNSNEVSYNFIINCGIHQCFSLFDEHKIKFVEGCMVNDIYNGLIKELIEKLDSTYDSCLDNTEDLELVSQYSSFISQKSKNHQK
jgi:hypothetical protein